MCLRIKKIRHLNHKAKIAKKPIKCYKVLICAESGLWTPAVFHNVYVPPKKLIADDIKTYTHDTIIENGIHTFSKFKTAYYYCDIMVGHRSSILGIFPAIIPKGTSYWVGKDNQYVSERIEFL